MRNLAVARDLWKEAKAPKRYPNHLVQQLRMEKEKRNIA